MQLTEEESQAVLLHSVHCIHFPRHGYTLIPALGLSILLHLNLHLTVVQDHHHRHKSIVFMMKQLNLLRVDDNFCQFINS